jgi:hypothetical protein
MTKRDLQIPAPATFVGGAAAGTIGIITPPLGNRYHSIDIVYIDGSGAPAQLNTILADIVLYKNGKEFRTHSITELDRLNGINGAEYTLANMQFGAGAGLRQTCRIFFAEPWRKDKSDTDYMALNVDGPNGFADRGFQIKLILAAALPATATFVVKARVDSPLTPPKGGAWNVKKVLRQNIPANGLATDYMGLTPISDYLQTVLMKNPSGGGSGYIQKATLKLNGNLVVDTLNNFDNIASLTALGLNPANSQAVGAFGYELVLDADDPIGSALPLAGSEAWLHLDYSAAATGNVVALIETLGPLN